MTIHSSRVELVIDASVALAYLYNEPGRERLVAATTQGAAISSVNLSEVVARLADRGMTGDQIEQMLGDLAPLEVVNFDRDLAVAAGLLRPTTRHAGLSLGDRACLALAAREHAVALTADRAWGELDLGVEIEVVQ